MRVGGGDRRPDVSDVAGGLAFLDEDRPVALDQAAEPVAGQVRGGYRNFHARDGERGGPRRSRAPGRAGEC